MVVTVDRRGASEEGDAERGGNLGERIVREVDRVEDSSDIGAD